MEQHIKRAGRNEYMRQYCKAPRGALYLCWRAFVKRCCDPTNRQYHRYGGRGISVCEDWKTFEPFFQWSIANGWVYGLQIDRTDNSKGYSPDNCRFVTCAKNNRNRSNNKLTEAKVVEIRKMLSDGFTGPTIAKKYGVHHSLIYRIKLGQQWL